MTIFTDLTHAHGMPEDHAPHVDCSNLNLSLVELSDHYNIPRVSVGEIIIVLTRRAPNHLNLSGYKSVSCERNDSSRAKSFVFPVTRLFKTRFSKINPRVAKVKFWTVHVHTECDLVINFLLGEMNVYNDKNVNNLYS